MPAGVVKQLWHELKQQGTSLTPAARNEQEYHFFCSFDLVNSTALKARERSWPVTIGSFSDFVIDAISKREKNLVPWKFAGDEVVFTQRVYRFGDLHKLVPRVFDALEFVIDRIYKHFEPARGLVSVRATAWGAFCLNGAGDLDKTIQDIATQPYRNIRIERRKGTETNPLVELDFMGPSIDEGFRLQKVAPKGRLAVSAELAFFLSQGGGLARTTRRLLKIVGFEKLKGIWSERLYPVVWYDTRWDHLEKSFGYDERYDDQLVAKLLSEKPKEITELKKILEDVGRLKQAHDSLQLLRRLKAPKKVEQRFQPPSAVSLIHPPARSVHCVAVCLDSKGRCLIARRGKAKHIYPGHWEFGCGQLSQGETFEQCLLKAYEEDFGAHLERGSLRPISTYTISGPPIVPGLIFVGRVTNPTGVRKKKHPEIRWIKLKDLSKFASEKCVPEFVETVRLAYAIGRER